MKKRGERSHLSLLPPRLAELLRKTRGQAEALDRWHLEWLLNFVQRDAALADDAKMVGSFTVFVLEGRTKPRPTLEELQSFAADVAVELRRFLTEGRAWSFAVPETRGVLEPAVTGVEMPPERSVTLPSVFTVKTTDWRSAFRVRAAELLAGYREWIRICERRDCGRLFLADDKRQTFCTPRCSHLKRLHEFRAKSKAENPLSR
jgi:hypothetical protein